MSGQGNSRDPGAGHWYARRANLEAFAALALIALAALAVTLASAGPGPGTTRQLFGTGRIVPIPDSIPHEDGDMVDRRIVPDLRWIAEHYPIYITDGYSGPLPDGTHVGCNRCHTRGSDHYNGLAVDIVPLEGDPSCDQSWRPISRLAHWAEPVQNRPMPPFRWVGYDGDAGHGCGNHLHLSWSHAPAPEYQPAEWVEVLPTSPSAETPTPTAPPVRAAPKRPKGPTGGVALLKTGGVAPRD